MRWRKWDGRDDRDSRDGWVLGDGGDESSWGCPFGWLVVVDGFRQAYSRRRANGGNFSTGLQDGQDLRGDGGGNVGEIGRDAGGAGGRRAGSFGRGGQFLGGLWREEFWTGFTGWAGLLGGERTWIPIL